MTKWWSLSSFWRSRFQHFLTSYWGQAVSRFFLYKCTETAEQVTSTAVQLFQALYVQHQSWRKRCRSSILLWSKKCQKGGDLTFSILKGPCFVTFFKTSKTERPREFPPVAHIPVSKHDDMGMKICLNVLMTGTNWSKKGNKNVLLRQYIELHQHGSGGWIYCGMRL